MIGVIDYKAGNAPSVLNALEMLGIPAQFVSTPEGVARAAGLILPGVGSAAATMDSLRELRLVEALRRRVLEEKVPFMGICVGLQVLFQWSEEGDTQCLGWLPGKVRRFPDTVRVPQIGWNEVRFTRESPVLKGLGQSEFFYFVNSYYVEPADGALALGVTEYQQEFCSMVNRENIYATQFHIEKSGAPGLQILKNFAGEAGIC
jgi:glutamine amidotransferase